MSLRCCVPPSLIRDDTTTRVPVPSPTDRDTDDVTGDMNVQEFMDWAQAEDPMENVNEDTVMPGRVSLLMRGIANAFGMRLRTAPDWKPAAKRLIDDVERGTPTGYGV